MKHTSYGTATLMLLIAAMCWGGMFPVSKAAIARIDPSYLMLIRYAGSAALCSLTLWFIEGKHAFEEKAHFWSILWIGCLGIAGFNLLAFNGLQYTSPQHAAIMMALQPMMAVLISWIFLKQAPKPFTIMAVITAFIGVFIVITQGDLSKLLDSKEVKGDLMLLTGGLCWVIYTMQGKRFPTWSPLKFTTLTSISGMFSIAVFAFSMDTAGVIEHPSITALIDTRWAILYIVVLAAYVAVLVWNIGIKILGAVNGMLFINIVPITAFIIGLMQGKSFTSSELAGAGLVIATVSANSFYLSFLQKQQTSTSA